MDTRRRGRTLVPDGFPDAVRRRLEALDRLRELWAERRRHGISSADPAAVRDGVRRRIEELRALAGRPPLPPERLRAEEDALVALAEDSRAGVRLNADYFDTLARAVPDFSPPLPAPERVGALLAEAAAVETHPLVRAAHLFLTCADALNGAPAPPPPDAAGPRHGRDAAAPLPAGAVGHGVNGAVPHGAGGAASKAAETPGGTPGGAAGAASGVLTLPGVGDIPVSTAAAAPAADDPAAPPAVRSPGPGAAEAPPGPPAPRRGDGPPAHLRPLPWTVASLSLMRSDLPPPAIDRRAAPPAAAAAPGSPAEGTAGRPRDPLERLAAMVLLLADLETAALRAELSRPARLPGALRPDSSCLGRAVHRRVVNHLRLRCDSLRMVLRELDPAARTSVGSSTEPPADPTAGPGTGPGAENTAASPGGAAAEAPGVPPLAERRAAAARRALFTPGPNEWRASVDVDLADGALRLVVFVQEVGDPASGVLAVTADGWLTSDEGAVDVLDLGCADCVTLVPADAADDRWPEVEAFTDDVLARAVGHLTRAARY
ncbi:hypothetical protein LG943_17875 [Streptomonospora sp. S1-112]|uniref:Uncharacterized protein n=1 Tax=Streptomonospora mangrovi TaxID=2883123 RepID=A0A9X3NQK4_9ACTN|nr:hypothetical protein [Streptomonospora mangrovi]MDA0566169.1 hypothetical protein [Streptomonospora mangrovi]